MTTEQAQRIKKIQQKCLREIHVMAEVRLMTTFFTAVMCATCLNKVKVIEEETE